MKKILTAMFALTLSCGPAFAADDATPATAADVKPGRMVRSVDGKRIGAIDAIRSGNAQIIFESRIVSIPTSTLTVKDKLLTTSLTSDQVKGR